MTPDERNLLSDLANKIAQAPTPPKDAEAEEFIRTKIGSRPDALYMMTQTVLIQNIALQQAQAQIQQLQRGQGAGAPASSGSFLGGGAPARPAGYGGGNSGAYNAPPPQGGYAAPSPGFSNSGAGGFLRGAAQTAAGVAAGTLAVQGIESLFHGGGLGGGGGLFGAGGYGGAPVEENVVNNYYDNGPNDSGYDNSGSDNFSGTDNSADFDNGGFDDNSGGFGDDGGGFDNSGDGGGGDNFV